MDNCIHARRLHRNTLRLTAGAAAGHVPVVYTEETRCGRWWFEWRRQPSQTRWGIPESQRERYSGYPRLAIYFSHHIKSNLFPGAVLCWSRGAIPQTSLLPPQCDMKHCLTNSKYRHIRAKRSVVWPSKYAKTRHRTGFCSAPPNSIHSAFRFGGGITTPCWGYRKFCHYVRFYH